MLDQGGGSAELLNLPFRLDLVACLVGEAEGVLCLGTHGAYLRADDVYVQHRQGVGEGKEEPGRVLGADLQAGVFGRGIVVYFDGHRSLSHEVGERSKPSQ